MKSWIREQRHVCGATEKEASYQEVDIFPVTERQHKASARGKKQLASTLVQKNLNAEKARRWFTQVAHTNFTEDDYIAHLTLSDKYHPKSEKEAWRIFERYVDRLNYHRGKEGLPKVKYMAVLELQGKKKPRYHFHVLMDGRLPQKKAISLWSAGRGRNKERLGACRLEYLDFEGHGGTIVALCNYMTKHPEGRQRWRPSRGLKKPIPARPSDSKYSRAKLAELCRTRLDDHDWWRLRYPGWELVEPATAKYNDFTGWSLYAKLRRMTRPRGQSAKRRRNKR